MAGKRTGTSVRSIIEWRYITDQRATLKSLAEEFGVSYRVLRNYASRHQWSEKKQAFWENVQQHAAKVVGTHLGELASYHFKVARNAIARAWPIFERKGDELSAAEAWRVIREAIELERRSTGIDEQVRALVIDHLQVLLAVLRNKLPKEQYEDIRADLATTCGLEPPKERIDVGVET
ncbi:MAG: hypothetical protein QXW98_04905 [Candidatus Caldarchaeum sp.]